MYQPEENVDKNKQERGSITLFVLIGILFFIIAVMAIMMNLQNNKINQEKEINKIQENYEIDYQYADQLYQEELDKAEKEIAIMLIKKSTFGTNKKEYFYNKNWYTAKGEENDLVLDVRFLKEVPEEKNYVVIRDSQGSRTYTSAQIKSGQAIVTENCVITAYSDKVRKEIRIEKIDRQDPMVIFEHNIEQFVEVEKGKTTTSENPVKVTIKKLYDKVSGVKSVKYGWTSTLGVEPVEYTDCDINAENLTIEKENATVGIYYLAVKVRDVAGNEIVIYSKPIIVEVDKTKPKYLEVQNSSNGNWTNQDVIITLKAEDNLNIGKFEMLKNGEWTSEGIVVSEGKKQRTATIIFSEDMNENVQFRVIDTSDNISELEECIVKIDKTKPTFIIQTDDEDVTKTRNVLIQLEDKQGSGISDNSECQYQLIPTGSTQIGEWQKYILGQQLIIGEGLTGKYYFVVKSVVDKAGNSSVTEDSSLEINGEVYQKLATYIFDNASPEEFIPIITNKSSNSITVTVETKDIGEAGLGYYEYYVNDKLKETSKESTIVLNNLMAQGMEPYIPTGFKYVEGTVETGYVIKDITKEKSKDGNEFVWIPINTGSISVHVIAYDKVGNSRKSETVSELLSEGLTRSVQGDTTDINSYIEDDGDENNRTSVAAFKKSVLEYGGFYVARYEAGIPDDLPNAQTVANATTRNVSGIPVSQKNKTPWDYISYTTAKSNAESMYKNSSGRTAMMNSYSWAMILNWIIDSGVRTQEEILVNGKTFGNFKDASVTNITEYSTDYGVKWQRVDNVTKSNTVAWLLKTGHTDFTKSNNIYDIAGNLREWTTEKYSNGNMVTRGGYYSQTGISANAREGNTADTAGWSITYRPILYANGIQEKILLEKNIQDEFTKEDITVTAKYSEGLTNLKLGMGKTLEEAKGTVKDITDLQANLLLTENAYVYASGMTGKGELIEESLYVGNIDKSLPIEKTVYEATGQGMEGEFQKYVVPETGSYTIYAYGASGSAGSSYGGTQSQGGKGAEVYGTFQLEKGDTLIIAVGQEGTISRTVTSGDATSGGGGGGTFVVKEVATSNYQLLSKSGEYVVPLIIAAGGNGGNDASYRKNVINGADGIYTSTGSSDGFTRFLTSPKGTSYSRNSVGTGGFVGGGASDDNNGPAGGWKQGTESNGAAYSYNAGTNQGGATGANQGNGRVEIYPSEELSTHVWVENVNANEIKISTSVIDMVSGVDNYQYYINGELKETSTEPTYVYTDIEEKISEPYIPNNFVHTEGTIDTGYVIKDVSDNEQTRGNEFVWVPVAHSDELEIYVVITDKAGNQTKTHSIVVQASDLQRGILGDTADLTKYYEDDGYIKDGKNVANFKKSVAQYGGFYVARYEAGIPTSLTGALTNAVATKRNVEGVPLSQKNAIPWNYITRAQALKNVESMYQTSSIQSSLMNSYAYDSLLNWIQDTGEKTQAQILTDSTSWGVYVNSTVSGVTEYSTDNGTYWRKVESTNKTSGTRWILKTGNSEYTKVKNIYDLAGSLKEWTAETVEANPVARGGSYYENGNSVPAKERYSTADTSDYKIGYRAVLYRTYKEGLISIEPETKDYTNKDLNVNIIYGEELQNYKLGIGDTLEEAKAALTSVSDSRVEKTLSKNQYIYAQANYASGDVVEEYTQIKNIDKQSPTGKTIFEATDTGLKGKYQEYVVPVTGEYIIKAYGASGSPGSSYNGIRSEGGRGAEVYGTFQLQKGDKLIIAVGQEGTISGVATSGDATSGAGGGGTFVVKEVASSNYRLTAKAEEYVEPLLIAAGGNGGNDASYRENIVNGADGVYTSTTNGDGFNRFLSSPDGVSYSRNVTATGGFVGGGASDDNHGPAGGWKQGTESNAPAYSYNAGTNQGGITGANQGNGRVEIYPSENLGGHIWVDSTNANEIKISTDIVDMVSEVEMYQYYINGELKETSTEPTYIYTGLEEKMTEPYIPNNFVHTEGTIETGYVIKDISDNEQTRGNEFVWVPVAHSDKLEVYVIATDKVGNQTKTPILKVHATDLRRGIEGDTVDLTYYDEDDGNLKDGKNVANFRKSVEQYGGFYVARYEAGIPTNLTGALTSAIGTKRSVDGVPVSQKNAITWNYITRAQALKNAESMYQTSSIQSSLMNSYAYDSLMNWIQNTGEKTQAQILTDSTSWGVYANATIPGVTEYSTDNGTYWRKVESANKASGTRWILKTGNSEYSKVKNIYDLAGNLKEWTTETNETKAVARGGSYYENGNSVPAKERYNIVDNADYKIGYRAILYRTHEEGLVAIEPETKEYTKEDLNVNIIYGEDLQNYKLGIGDTLEEAKAALVEVSDSRVVRTLTRNQYVYAQASYETGEIVEEYTQIRNIDKQAPTGKTVFEVSGTGAKGEYQEYIVPATGEYTIKAYGASGSPGSSYNGIRSEGGKGAEVYGTFQLQKGEKLIIAVGQEGTISGVATTEDATSGAGGGGTFVVKQVESSQYHLTAKAGEYVEPLIVAAGGNGGNDAFYKENIINGANGIYTSTSSSDGFTKFLTSPNGTSYSRVVTATGGFVGGGASDDNYGPAGGWKQGTESNGAAYSYNAGINQGGATGVNQGNGRVEIEANIGHIWVDTSSTESLNIITDFTDMQSGIDHYDYYINNELVNTSKQDSFVYTKLDVENITQNIPSDFEYQEGTVGINHIMMSLKEGENFIQKSLAITGNLEIYVIATDKAGNEARTETVTISLSSE